MALTFFLIVFIDYGSDITGVKAVANNRDDKDELNRLFAITYSAKIAVLLAVVAIMTTLFWFVPYFCRDRLLFVLGLPILLGQYLNPTWFLQGVENFKLITAMNILSKVIYVIGIFAFVTTKTDYIYINLWWGIGMVAANGIGFFYIVQKYSFTFGFVTPHQVRTQLRENFSMFFSQIFVSIQLYSPLILIGFLGNPTMTGIYRVVDQVVVIFKTYILLFFNFAFPRVCYLLAESASSGLRFWKRYNGANLALIILAMLAVYISAEPIVTYFHPEQTDLIAGMLRFAVLIPTTMAVSVPLKQLVLGWNFQKFYINSTMALVLVNALLIILLLPIFGIYGVLASIAVIELVTAVLFFVKIKSHLRG